jgi:hypothetical protein
MKRGMGSPKYDRSRAREVQSLGGRGLQASGKAHRWALSSVQARENGRLGGLRRAANLRARDEESAA